jgi:hypothetical protein
MFCGGAGGNGTASGSSLSSLTFAAAGASGFFFRNGRKAAELQGKGMRTPHLACEGKDRGQPALLLILASCYMQYSAANFSTAQHCRQLLLASWQQGQHSAALHTTAAHCRADSSMKQRKTKHPENICITYLPPWLMQEAVGQCPLLAGWLLWLLLSTDGTRGCPPQ